MEDERRPRARRTGSDGAALLLGGTALGVLFFALLGLFASAEGH
jgi:hypothetical protein